ncbi:hypothetical protein J2R76_005819 [Bradyrhizobium sp. USDA 4532]|uniref:hypothetical protein n=1 Tax=unclassified Bradyrhizobium TaxID=2631580 RepID=UPI00209DF044|nr:MULTISPECIES: hypothetical protein [unclassified Bradyrhizobium]MCP1829119.1 hypothetical protein [Bradyrhizobium sp. USDA 4545]MCP1922228.1 hypothetical protein [Bradyrhizobium sp. USDA 4532]
MPEIVKTITIEQTIDTVIKQVSAADPASPQTLRDHVTQAGQHDPYKASVALRAIRMMLKPPLGTHVHLTQQKKWAYEREQWAKDAGLKKGRVELDFEPETETTRALVEALDSNQFLPDTAREAVTSISSVLALRANKKLDEHSAAVVGDSVEELMHEIEVQARLMEEKEVRIQQAERHAEDLRRTNDRLLAIMEQVIGKPVSEGSLLHSEDREKGGTRQRSN